MTIEELRNKIDAIDKNIVTLLGERLEIVKQVGHLKQKSVASNKIASFIRSGREANMLRNLIKFSENILPPQMVATIWRMIISLSLGIEQNIQLLCFNEKDNNSFWLAREYFGAFTPINLTNSADELIAKVSNNASLVGILPLFDESEKPWWLRPEDETNNIYVFAKVPFLGKVEAPIKPVFAIANTMPEATGDDISVFVIKTKLDKNELLQLFKSQFTAVNIISDSNKDNFLLEIAGYITKDDAGIVNLKQNPDIMQLRYMGAYSVVR